MTGVHLASSSSPLPPPLKGIPHCPALSPYREGGHLAVTNSAARVVSLIAFFYGRCCAVCEDRCIAVCEDRSSAVWEDRDVVRGGGDARRVKCISVCCALLSTKWENRPKIE